MIIPSTQGGARPAWSPDGRMLAFAQQGDIIVLDGTTLDAITTYDLGANEDMPNWSLDGRRLTFLSTREDVTKVFIVDFPNGNPQAIEGLPPVVSKPIWNAVGTGLIFVALNENDPESRYDIFIASLDNPDGYTILIGGNGDQLNPSLSPDGERIVYASSQETLINFFIYKIATGEQQQITQMASDNRRPVFSPDGSLIVFMRSETLDPPKVFNVCIISSTQLLQTGCLFEIGSSGDLPSNEAPVWRAN